jgi:hypothetical protein
MAQRSHGPFFALSKQEQQNTPDFVPGDIGQPLVRSFRIGG